MASLSLRHIPESEMSLIFVSISNEECHFDHGCVMPEISVHRTSHGIARPPQNQHFLNVGN